MHTTQMLHLAGRRFVVIEEGEYERLCRQAGQAVAEDDLPPLPTPDADGTYPALEYARISLARSLIRDRRAARLSQQQLAALAGVRQETISRLETGKHSASVPTIQKIDRVLKRAIKRRTKQP
ncbi:MAG: helix-turn-helix domain-containing protein [Phycisphaeraceae bacterium]